jgi:hypothetical protein
MFDGPQDRQVWCGSVSNLSERDEDDSPQVAAGERGVHAYRIQVVWPLAMAMAKERDDRHVAPVPHIPFVLQHSDERPTAHQDPCQNSTRPNILRVFYCF